MNALIQTWKCSNRFAVCRFRYIKSELFQAARYEPRREKKKPWAPGTFRRINFSVGMPDPLIRPHSSTSSFWFCKLHVITKTCLYNFDPLKPHFYIVKLGLVGVYIILFTSAQKHRLWVLVRNASLRRFSRVPTIYVLSRNMKISESFYLKIFSFFSGKIFSTFE